ncbi:MAG: DoxX family protein [Rickettsiales bacterium]|nr:DoxX family protein [Pseudomonadota bacterium]MDA0966261.1 DoxX family protein [Pseudomonadota bacterium]MDG4543074.1 DoxX family protein [Rickettsiales bacterium]MDG4545272.1 DoxX family protein [Rickettsiales bacterium]MDG4547721.1 DoxX family protein [Rickettsiales bacterium]
MTNKTKKIESDNKPTEKKCGIIAKFSIIFKLIEFKLKIADFLSPLVNLGIRFWMAWIFLKSGVLKIPKDFLGLNIGKGYSWDSTIYLFEEVHPVPLLSPNVAAVLGTGLEILCPILLIIGLGARPAAAVLLIMTGVIEFTSDPDFLSETARLIHQYWMILLAVIVFNGPGKLSVDHIIRKKSLSCPKYREIAGIKEA